ncbi:hypothetical protein H8959_000959 [Pygathrix nigripes]
MERIRGPWHRKRPVCMKPLTLQVDWRTAGFWWPEFPTLKPLTLQVDWRTADSGGLSSPP